jgi:hypothetical protein
MILIFPPLQILWLYCFVLSFQSLIWGGIKWWSDSEQWIGMNVEGSISDIIAILAFAWSDSGKPWKASVRIVWSESGKLWKASVRIAILSQDFKLGPPKYKAGLLTAQSQHLVILYYVLYCMFIYDIALNKVPLRVMCWHFNNGSYFETYVIATVRISWLMITLSSSRRKNVQNKMFGEHIYDIVG